MALRSCLKQNAAHEDALQALLESSNSWINPNQVYLEAAYHLGELGFIQLKEHYFIKCANPLDALDFDSLINPDCENKIPIPDDFDESCDDLICEECGRYILPITQQKQRFHVVSLSLQKQAIVQWLEAGLRELVFKNPSAGIYHVLLDNGFVTVILPDFIDNPSYLAVDRIKAQPTLIITLRKTLPHLPLDVHAIKLSDFINGNLSLKQALDLAMEHGIPKEIPNVSRQILPFVSLHQPKMVEKQITYRITIDSEGIFVGGIHVIGKQAPSRIQIFRILLEQYWRDFEEGKPKEMHTPLNLHQIAERLEPHMGLIDDLEQQIRRPLNKMQKAIEETLAKELGVNIKRDDFAQDNGLNLSAISGSICGVDLFIGEQLFLHKGWGTIILNEFEKQLLVPHFDLCLIDPAKDNLTAIKAFTKAGFKIFEQFQTESNIWMIKDLSSRNDPLPTIQKLIKERYVEAKAVFWAGSVSQGKGTSASDLDLVIVFEEVANAYREAFIYDGWPIDAFIHDLNTLRYFCGKLEASDGKPALINMILQGQEILAQNSLSIEAKVIAADALANGPDAWNQAQIDKERFLITDILDDIKSPKNKEEQIISAVHLFEPLLQFYFRAATKWTASGKSLIRLLKAENPELAEEWTTAFEILIQTGDSKAVETVVTKILEPYGGYLWDGFRSDASADWKECDENKILDELKSREPIFHHPEKFGKTKEDIENQMCDEFWEVGASGNVYTKQDVIETLLERYNDPDYQDIWEAKDFELTKIAPDNYLLTYSLIQDKTRATRRSTLWRRVNGDWKILYHQGTLIEEGSA